MTTSRCSLGFISAKKLFQSSSYSISPVHAIRWSKWWWFNNGVACHWLSSTFLGEIQMLIKYHHTVEERYIICFRIKEGA